ncbi:hypothetical protein [Micromonospora coerulea]|uniref:hypothetical protein n=1 Tax=Micromonospora coerulea TaxID=47856 RepID=UPI0019071A1D|nr:hypothetical protein [Micromonospora veneta]
MELVEEFIVMQRRGEADRVFGEAIAPRQALVAAATRLRHLLGQAVQLGTARRLVGGSGGAEFLVEGFHVLVRARMVLDGVLVLGAVVCDHGLQRIARQ